MLDIPINPSDAGCEEKSFGLIWVQIPSSQRLSLGASVSAHTKGRQSPCARAWCEIFVR